MDPGIRTARLLRLWATPAELRLWQFLRAHRLAGYSFRRQHPLGPYIVDFVCLRRHLVIEVDGGCHDANFEYDQVRSAYLKRLGFRVLRFSNSSVMFETDETLRTIEQHLMSPKL